MKCKLILYSLVLSALVPAVRADYHIVQKATYRNKDKTADKTTAMMMNLWLRKLLPDSEYWLSTDRAVLIVKIPGTADSKTTVVDLAQGTCTVLLSRTKRYVTTTLPFDPAAVYTETVLELIRSRRRVPLTPNDLRRKIRGFPCVGYSITAGGADDWAAQGTLWVTEKLRLDPDKLDGMLAILAQTNVATLLALPNSELRGFPMVSEVDSPSMTLTIEAVKVEEKPLPEKLLVPPRDYVRVEKLDVGDVIDENDKMMKQMFGIK
jgi:hypothetical protein